MITETDKAIFIQYAKKYNVSSVYLFGSSLEDNIEARDIDLGVKGIAPEQFFKFYGELLRNLSKDIDLVDLSKKSLFNDMAKERGVQIYGMTYCENSLNPN
jgi:predicted nucleotidyltransferase